MLCLKRILLVLTCLATLSILVNARSKRVITPGDIVNIRKVSDPQISPGGEWVVCVVTESALAVKPGTAWDTNIWIVSASGSSPPRKYALSPGSDESPRWSPDGKYLAFLSNRRNNKKHQLYLLPVTGGEAQKISTTKEGVITFKWLSDSSTIAFISTDPISAEEEKQPATGSDVYVVGEVCKFARLYELSIKTGKTRLITKDNENIYYFDYSPDNSRVCMLVTATPQLDDIFRAKLIIQNRDGSKRKGISDNIMLWTLSPLNLSWSPDGDRIACFMRTPPDFPIPGIIGQDGNIRAIVSNNYPGIVWEMDWLPGGKKLLVSVQEGVRGSIGRLDIKSGKIDYLRKVGRPYWAGPYWNIDKRTGSIVFIDADNDSPEDIWIMKSDSSDVKKLTHFNPQVESLSFGEQEQVSWKSSDGTPIDGILIKPPGFRKGTGYPLIVIIHGGPTWSWWSGWHGTWHEWGQFLASNGYAVLLPNPRGSGTYGAAFACKNIRNWARGPFDDIIAGVDFLIEKGIADPDKLGIGGWSYGGYLTAWVITQTSRFKAAVMGAGIVNLISFYGTFDIPTWVENYFTYNPYDRKSIYEKNSPLTYVNNVKTPTLIIHGKEDLRPHPSQSYEFYQALRKMRVKTKFVMYPREGHGIREPAHQVDLLKRILEWYDSHLKK